MVIFADVGCYESIAHSKNKIIIRPHRMHRVQRCVLLIYADVARSVCLCLLNTTVSPTKTEEPIEMSFGLWTRVGPRKFWWEPGYPGEGAIFFGGGIVPH